MKKKKKKRKESQGLILKASTGVSDHEQGSGGQGDQTRAKRGQWNEAESALKDDFYVLIYYVNPHCS